MEIKFKKYPENEPNYNCINYLCIVNCNEEFFYGFRYFNDNCEFELKNEEKVVAFTEEDPKKAYVTYVN